MIVAKIWSFDLLFMLTVVYKRNVQSILNIILSCYHSSVVLRPVVVPILASRARKSMEMRLIILNIKSEIIDDSLLIIFTVYFNYALQITGGQAPSTFQIHYHVQLD